MGVGSYRPMGEKARMVHMVINYSCGHQYQPTINLISTQLVTYRSVYTLVDKCDLVHKPDQHYLRQWTKVNINSEELISHMMCREWPVACGLPSQNL